MKKDGSPLLPPSDEMPEGKEGGPVVAEGGVDGGCSALGRFLFLFSFNGFTVVLPNDYVQYRIEATLVTFMIQISQSKSLSTKNMALK
jgi:hypothetical protein